VPTRLRSSYRSILAEKMPRNAAPTLSTRNTTIPTNIQKNGPQICAQANVSIVFLLFVLLFTSTSRHRRGGFCPEGQTKKFHQPDGLCARGLLYVFLYRLHTRKPLIPRTTPATPTKRNMTERSIGTTEATVFNHSIGTRPPPCSSPSATSASKVTTVAMITRMLNDFVRTRFLLTLE